MGILSLLLWTPILGCLLLLGLPARYEGLIRWTAISVGVLVLMPTLWLAGQFQPHDAAQQWAEHFALNPALGNAYALGVDGLSMPLLVLCALLALAALLSSSAITLHIKGYYVCLLVLEFALLGVLLTQDWVMFYFFLELMLAPVYFLVGHWGGKRRQTASIRFILYMLAGSVLMILSFFALSQYRLTADGPLLTAMQHSAQAMPESGQIWVLLGFVLGLGIKLPIFPVHGWLPLVQSEAPGAVACLLSGLLLTVAAYGLLRVLPVLPDAALILQPFLVLLALAGILYGSLLAWRQTEFKPLLAYASISQMGWVLLDVSALNQAGFNAALLQMLAHGLTAGGLFLLGDFLAQRSPLRQLRGQYGLAAHLPRWGGLMGVALFGGMAFPGTLGFIALLHSLLAFYPHWGWLWLLALCGPMLVAGYSIRLLGLWFFGNAAPNFRAGDLSVAETLAATLLIVPLLWLGLQPSPLLAIAATSAITWPKAFKH